jgi:hypothetical protein
MPATLAQWRGLFSTRYFTHPISIHTRMAFGHILPPTTAHRTRILASGIRHTGPILVHSDAGLAGVAEDLLAIAAFSVSFFSPLFR